MTRLGLFAVPALIATAALAQDMPEVPDADGNGTWSLAELQAVWTDLTEEGFAAIDTNADGEADLTEVQTAWANGILKPVGG
jgi:hypothetical protein